MKAEAPFLFRAVKGCCQPFADEKVLVLLLSKGIAFTERVLLSRFVFSAWTEVFQVQFFRAKPF